LDWLLADLNHMAAQVYYKITQCEDSFILECDPKQSGPDAIEQVSQVARFGQVVIRASVQRSDLIGFRSMNREDDDRCLNQGAETTGNFDSIDIRQSDIENDHIGPQDWYSLEDNFARTSLMNEIPPRGQSNTENVAKRLLVINYQNLRATIGQAAPSVRNDLLR
jgi:hypothetical protein